MPEPMPESLTLPTSAKIKKIGDTYYMPTDEEPTLWNGSMLMTGVIMGLAAGAAAFFAGGVGLGLAALGAAGLVGGGIGAVAGKSRMKREREEGIKVPPPTFFNVSLFSALNLGLVGLAGITLLAATGEKSSEMTHAGSRLAIFGIFSGLIGGWLDKRDMAERYTAAEAAYAAQENKETGLPVSYMRSVTPEQTQLLETRMKAGAPEFASRVEQQHSALNAQPAK